jgi:hypothetical protein
MRRKLLIRIETHNYLNRLCEKADERIERLTYRIKTRTSPIPPGLPVDRRILK